MSENKVENYVREIRDKVSLTRNSFLNLISWQSEYSVTKNSAVNVTNFTSPIKLDSDSYEIALNSLETYYSFPNVNEGVNNNFKYSINGVPQPVISLPTGNYGIEDVGEALSRLVTPNVYGNFALFADNATLKCYFKITPGYTIDFTYPNSINTILGFNSRVVGNVPGQKNYFSDNIVSITSVNSLLIHCDLIDGSYNNGKREQVIYSFFPNVAPGFKIVETANNLIYLPINTKEINRLTVWITDQDNNLVNFRNETITIKFHLRRKL